MAYRQTAYNQLQGIDNGKKRYTIAEIGCFITSFCNLVERFGINIDPPSLDNILRDRQIYIDVDDGIRDDVYWDTICKIYGDIHVTQIGTGWPQSNNAIVKFTYKSPRSGRTTTHFCLMADASQQLILDPWDGAVKHSGIYGTPTGFAVYEKSVPQPVTPVMPQAPTPAAQAPQKPTFTVENIEPFDVVLNKDTTKLWNLDTRDWNQLVSSPVSQAPKGTRVTVGAKLYSMFGGTYYLPNRAEPYGYNVVDCDKYVEPQTPIQDIKQPELPTVSAQPVDNSEEKVEVKVIPPELKWQQSYVPHKQPVMHYALRDFTIEDLDGDQPNKVVQKGTKIIVGGWFKKNDYEYWRTVKSIENGHWYGIPVDNVNKDPIDEFMDQLYNDESLINEAKKINGNLSIKEKFIASVATLSGIAHRLFVHNKNKGDKNNG